MNSKFSSAVANDNARTDTLPVTNSEGQNLYLTALRHFVRLEEEATSHALNAVRRVALRADAENGEERHWSTLTSADLQKIMPDLTVARFQALYGDYKSNVATPWNTLPAIVQMVGEHLARLGTDNDVYEFALFLQNHAPASQKNHALVID